MTVDKILHCFLTTAAAATASVPSTSLPEILTGPQSVSLITVTLVLTLPHTTPSPQLSYNLHTDFHERLYIGSLTQVHGMPHVRKTD
jgi:hypothetical protein